MDLNNYKNALEDIINTCIYKTKRISKEQKENLKEIKDYLLTSNDLITDLHTLLTPRNNENYLTYDLFLEDFFINADLKTKLDLLNNKEKYQDILKDNKVLINIWESLNDKEKISYLEKKKKYDESDTLFINNTLMNIKKFEENVLLKEIFYNKNITPKITPYSIKLKYSYNLLSYINCSDFTTCSILTKESYTNILLKKCNTFNEFLEIYNSNKKIYNLISKNSLSFNIKDNKDIYKFLISNPNFIGKFNKKYLELLSNEEILKISKSTKLDTETISTLLEKLYELNKDKANEYFSEENLRRCSVHSLSVYPFDNLTKQNKEKIFSTYFLFNKWLDTIMIEAINNNFTNDEIINILRNDDFIKEITNYGLELIINRLSFGNAFNMLQRTQILEKINNLNITISEKDSIFFKGYLESPTLISKTNHAMLYNMLNLLDKEETEYFIVLPYIIKGLTSYEIIDLAITKNLNLIELYDTSDLKDKLTNLDLIKYLNRAFQNNIDLNILKDKKLFKKIFNINDKTLKSIDINEVNYLYETIKMKSILSKQSNELSLASYKAVLASYLTFGIKGTIGIIDNGNKDITLNEILERKSEIINEKLYLFEQDNSQVFQNITSKVLKNLDKLPKTDDLNELSLAIKKNSYLDNIIYLMLNNNYDNYNEIITKFKQYIQYKSHDEFQSKKEIYDYLKDFINFYIFKKEKEYSEEFDEMILENFKPKESVLYRERKRNGKEFLDHLKFKIFVRSLTDPNKDLYRIYFRDGYPIKEVKKKYLKYLKVKEINFQEILEHILNPIVNKRFNEENCLNKLGIKKPANTDEYLKYLEDLKSVMILNTELDKLKEKFKDEEIITIMNYILYRRDIPFKLKKRDIIKLNKLANNANKLSGEIYVDKSKLKFIYNNNIDIYNIDEITEYKKYLEIIDTIIKKTYSYINKNLDNEKVKEQNAKDYIEAISKEDCTFPLTNKYYEPKKRVLSLKDLETIFNGFELNGNNHIDKSLKKFLFTDKNLIMVADGYYTNLVDNLGIIISNWPSIKKYLKKLEKDPNNISLLYIEKILLLMNYKDNPLINTLDEDVLKTIYNEEYYEIDNSLDRLQILSDLYEKSLTRITSTVPYLCYKDDLYEVKILDNYSPDILKASKDSEYKVGTIGNDFLHYSILNKNGIQIGIYREDELIAKVLGIRNGNTIYLNTLEGIKDENYPRLLKLFSQELLSITKEDEEPLNFVTIVNNNLYKTDNELTIDKTINPIIDNPINKEYTDYYDFQENKNLLNNFHTNYEDNITTLIASNEVVDKENFLYYDATAKYYRKRQPVKRLSNNITGIYLNKINEIIYLCKKLNKNLPINNITLNNIDTIYLGDDYVLLKTPKKLLKFVLPYDKRAKKEIELLEKDLMIMI